MRLGLSVDEVLQTTRSVRKRLDFDRPVSRETIAECLALAFQAPNGSNRQRWQWVCVDDEAQKLALAEIYRSNFAAYGEIAVPEPDTGDSRSSRDGAIVDSSVYLAQHLERAPVFVIPCIEGRIEDLPVAAATVSQLGSILPAAWSFMLALRERGLGSAWTSMHLLFDGERRAADVIGLPYTEYTQVGLFPVAYTKGTDFHAAAREPVEQVWHWNHW
jgi:nitroreductase